MPMDAKAYAERLVGHEIESARWNEDGMLVITEKARIQSYITIDCIIGPGPELNAERSRFLSVLRACYACDVHAGPATKISL
jgi:hypothetical protein